MSKKKKKPSRNPAKPEVKKKPQRPPAPNNPKTIQSQVEAPKRLPFWMLIVFLAAFLAGGASTVMVTGGFNNELTPPVFLLAMGGGFLFTAILSGVINYIAGSRLSKKGVQKAVIVVMAVGLILSLALTAIGSFDEPASNSFTGEIP